MTSKKIYGSPSQAPIVRVGVGLLIPNDHNEVLLTLRKRAPEVGCWSIVGGKVVFGERLGDVARREALEETRLYVTEAVCFLPLDADNLTLTAHSAMRVFRWGSA